MSPFSGQTPRLLRSLPNPDYPPHRCSLLDALCFGKKTQREGNSAHDQSPVTPLMMRLPAQPWTEFAFLATTPH